MTDTPTDPVSQPEPESVNDSSSQPEPPQWTAPGAAAQQDPPAATESSTPPTPTAESDSPYTPTASPAATQTTDSYPTAPQDNPQTGNGAFGHTHTTPSPQQPYEGQVTSQQYQGSANPYASQPGYANQPTQPIGGPPAPPRERSPKKRGAGFVVAVFAIGALVGGASGAGVLGIVTASQSNSTQPTSNTGAGNITVNNASEATPVTAVAAKASPSVVTISVTGTQEAGTGSGIILTDDGYVLTNTHVVTLDGEIAHPAIQVQANDGKLYSATVVGTDPIVDLAVIKIKDASGLAPATFANSSKLNVGDQAVAIGAPLGLSGTVTDGIVSSLNRSIQISSSAAPKDTQQQDQGQDGKDSPFNLWNFDLPGQGQPQQSSAQGTISLPVIQTDAAINPGNSGGALLNSNGDVIGINVAIASASKSSSSNSQSGSIGVGFAIPSNLGQRVAKEIMKDKTASHGLLGAMVKDASSSTTSNTVGATIASVTRGGAAQKAGLRAGDIVTNFNNVPISNPIDLTAQVRYLAADSKASITYVRDGKSYTTNVTLGELTE